MLIMWASEGIEAAPGNNGGFIAVDDASDADNTEPPVSEIDATQKFEENWKSQGVDRLVDLLSYRKLEKLVGNLAYSCFRDVWQSSVNVPPVTLFRFWGKYTRNFNEHTEALANIANEPAILISTPQRLSMVLDGDADDTEMISEVLLETCGVIVIDEAHRAAAPIYRSIIDSYRRSPETCIIGLTATPFRKEYQDDSLHGTRQLKQLFKEIIEPVDSLGHNAKEELQLLGYLAAPVQHLIETGVRLHSSMTINDQNALSLENIKSIDRRFRIDADKARRRLSILYAILPVFQQTDAQVLYFGPSVVDAETMAFMLRQEGLASAFVGGKTHATTRRRIISDFKSGRLKVLCNCEVLTTGFDAPKVTHVVMARPTASLVLYEQMLGRGLRGPLFGGTEKCIVFDCKDDFHEGWPPPIADRIWNIWREESIKSHPRIA